VSRLRVGLEDDVVIAVLIQDFAGAGLTGLTPTLAITAPDATAVTLTSATLTAWNATIVPGFYRLTVPAATFGKTGVHSYTVDPGSASAAKVPAGSFERIPGQARALVSSGRLAFLEGDDFRLQAWIEDLSGDGLGGLTPTAKLVKPDGTELVLSPATLTALATPAGMYYRDVADSIFSATGLYAAIVAPGSVAAVSPGPFVFERVPLAYSYDLCTITDVKAIIASKEGTVTALATDQEALVRSVIRRISAIIETYCARKFAARTFTETANGEGGFRHWIANPPVISLTSVTINGTAQTLANIVVDPATGELYHKAGIFQSWPPRAVTVVYQGGYAVLPQDIVQLATEMSAHRFKLYDRKNIGVRSEGIGQGDRQYITDDFLPQHVEVMDRHRLSWGTASAASYG